MRIFQSQLLLIYYCYCLLIVFNFRAKEKTTKRNGTRKNWAYSCVWFIRFPFFAVWVFKIKWIPVFMSFLTTLLMICCFNTLFLLLFPINKLYRKYISRFSIFFSRFYHDRFALASFVHSLFALLLLCVGVYLWVCGCLSFLQMGDSFAIDVLNWSRWCIRCQRLNFAIVSDSNPCACYRAIFWFGLANVHIPCIF